MLWQLNKNDKEFKKELNNQNELKKLEIFKEEKDEFLITAKKIMMINDMY